MPAADALGYNRGTEKFPKIPMKRDTWMLAARGYTVIRFRANNPGVWFFHCHMDWHNIAGRPFELFFLNPALMKALLGGGLL